MICTFCRIEREHVVRGPNLYICDECVERIAAAHEIIDTGDYCSFCNNPRGAARAIIGTTATGDARICTVCIVIARDVIAHDRKTRASRH